MNNKRRAIGVVLCTVALVLAAVAVVSAHHNGLYLNFDPGKQTSMGGKENYAHLWWVQYDASMYWKANDSVRPDVLSTISDWTGKVSELTWIESTSDYDIEFKLGNCPGYPALLGCVTAYTFSNDFLADANYQDTADVWVQDRTDWGANGQRSVIAHELGHLYGLHGPIRTLLACHATALARQSWMR